MKCSDDAAIQEKFVKKERIYDFLAGLNLEFDVVKSTNPWRGRLAFSK